MIEKKMYEYTDGRVRLRLDANNYVVVGVKQEREFQWHEVSLYGINLLPLKNAIEEFMKLNPK